MQAGDAEQAEAGLRRLLDNGEVLAASAFNSLISMYAKSQQGEKAEGVLQLMQRAQVQPTLVTFNSIASMHAFGGDIEATERIMQQVHVTACNLACDLACNLACNGM